MFKGQDKWIKEWKDALKRLEDSAETACNAAEDVILERIDSTTPTLSHTLINSFDTEITKTEDSITLEVSFNSDGSAPYAIEQHEAPYNHDYPHNSPEVRSFTGGTPLRYLARPMIDERDVLWNRIKDKVGWK